jgi:hypothetical protein
MVKPDATLTRQRSVDEAEPGEERVATLEQRARLRRDLLAFGSYVVGALFVTLRLFAHLGQRLPPQPGDRALAEWWLTLSARLVTHLGNPMFTDRMNAPDGVNTMANTTMFGLGIPMTPITLLFGPAVTFDLLIVIGIAGTAAAWYYLLSRHLVTSRFAAWIGGLVCGFAPSVITHASWHPNLTAQFLVPVIIWRVFRLREPGRWLRNGLVLGGLIVYQAFINEETLFIAALACGLLLAGYLLMRRDEAKAARTFLAGLGVAGLLAVLLLVYPLWSQFAGRGSYRGGEPTMTQFHLDVFAFTSFASNSAAERLSVFRPPPALGSEEHAYLGWPLVLLVILLASWRWREPLVRCAAITGGTFALLSLGAKPTVLGRPLGVPGPWALIDRLPLFDSMLATRFGEVLTWAIGPILAIGWDRLRALPEFATEASTWARRLLMGGAFAAALVPATPLPVPVNARPAIPAFVANGTWHDYVGPGDSVLVAPLPTWGDPTGMLWTAATGLDMRLSHGYFLAPVGGVKGHHSSVGPVPRPTDRLFDEATSTGQAPTVTDADRSQARADFAYWHTAIILVPDRAGLASARSTVSALAGPGRLIGGVWVWDVRAIRG